MLNVQGPDGSRRPGLGVASADPSGTVKTDARALFDEMNWSDSGILSIGGAESATQNLKCEVAEELALEAVTATYGRPTTDALSPDEGVPVKVRVAGSNDIQGGRWWAE
jgi:hypothetical protein